MVIVDTSVLIDFLGNFSTPQAVWLRQENRLQRIGITSLALTEVLQGIRESSRFAPTLSALSHLRIFEIESHELAIQSAMNYRTLRARGITIHSTIDCLIATFCIEESHELLHCDSDFDYFEQHLGLLVVDTSAVQPN